MAKSKETFGKKEKEKKRLKQRQDKLEKMEERKANAKKGKTLVNKIHREATEQVQQALLNVTDEEKTIIAKGIMTYAQALKAISEKK